MENNKTNMPADRLVIKSGTHARNKSVVLSISEILLYLFADKGGWG